MTSAKRITAYRWRHSRNINVLKTWFAGRLTSFAIAGDYFELESIPDIFCGMYVTLTTWKEIRGSRASKRPSTEGGTTLCPWYGTVSWRTRVDSACMCVCDCVEEKKTRRTRRYLSCGDTCGWVSLQIALIVYISCEVFANITSDRARSVVRIGIKRYRSKNETIQSSIVRNSKRYVLDCKKW